MYILFITRYDMCYITLGIQASINIDEYGGGISSGEEEQVCMTLYIVTLGLMCYIYAAMVHLYRSVSETLFLPRKRTTL